MTDTPKLVRPPSPMLDRLRAVHAESQTIGAFIEWLGEQDTDVCEVHFNISIEALLARYYGIDLAKVEAERQAIVASLHEDA